ncbi:MAG: helix-turn-helix domain-containing protein [Pseudomonadales bacterium]
MTRLFEISAAYTRLMLQSELLPAAELLKNSGLTAKSVATLDYIDWQPLAIIYRNIAQAMASPAWTARLGSQFNISSHGALGFAALSAPTLGDALEVMATWYPVRNTAMTADIELTDTRYVVRIQDLTGDPDFSRWMSEIIFKIFESLLETILGHPVGKNVIVAFAHPPPAMADELIAAYDATVIFNAEVNSISVPVAWHRLPSPLYDESGYRANLAKCRETVAARERNNNPEFVVRMLLSNHFDRVIAGELERSAPPTQDNIAAEMHLSTRTLIRHLQREGTAFKKILEALRREYAQTLLHNARLTVADVGELLGYGEPANFGRAFRRWYGTSPAAWRRQ